MTDGGEKGLEAQKVLEKKEENKNGEKFETKNEIMEGNGVTKLVSTKVATYSVTVIKPKLIVHKKIWKKNKNQKFQEFQKKKRKN